MTKAYSVRTEGECTGKHGNVGVLKGDNSWVEREARRRSCSKSQIIRDALRAYRQLVPESEKYEKPDNTYLLVNF